METLAEDTKILTRYFRETDRGLELCDPTNPPSLKAFEAMAYKLRAERDCWQVKVGDLAVALRHAHGPTAYQMVLEKTGLEAVQTVEAWAVTCRAVPVWVRNGLSISFLRTVAPIQDHLDQKELLDYAKKEGLTTRQFEVYVSHRFKDIDIPDEPPPAFESDQLFEAHQESYRLEVRLQEQTARAERAERKVEALTRITQRIEAILSSPPTEVIQNITRVLNELRAVVEELRLLVS